MIFKKKRMIVVSILFSILLVSGLAGVLFLNQPSFGCIPQGKRLERVKQSAHYDGREFVNEEKTVTMTGDRDFLEVWRDFLFGDKSKTVPSEPMKVIKTDLKSLLGERDWIV